ncbi:hypothetical protein GCM10010377_73250 [Streptomyces viridiviolaceus]|uniref:Uncharacterized protein n=1 Tax=Streptomyces viridiviolaceus TaxID=68282 RepID=A0ABW2DX85_9ACTN|nr:hypothetical protein [Streptomyces viridiviolaceus]GHB72029.1 hypothetical protein GCM10010377_73250 [Streptomyces viridiviolaceus]
MSPNRKKALAVVIAFLISVVAALVCGIAMSIMGHSGSESLAAGAGAWAVLMTLSVTVIALFDFKDDRTPSTPPNQPGAPTP